jgi:hypothetical protein
MNVDAGLIAEQIDALWATHGPLVITVLGVAAAILVLGLIIRIARSPQRDRWVGGLTALVVLAWTSEGLWEVANDTLGLPLGFAVMTFFVYEAMMITAALQAERHRRHHPSPGPAGRYVWVLATITASVVALNSATVVESVFRFTLPLAAAGLWWVGITAKREDDPPEVRAAREQLATDREARWAISWHRILVSLGVMRPGRQTLTDAERERRFRQMLAAASRIRRSRPGSWNARRGERRLNQLTLLASANDIARVKSRVARAFRIADEIRSGDDPLMADPSHAGPAGVNGHREGAAPDLVHATAQFRPDVHGAVARNGRELSQGNAGDSPRVARNGVARARKQATTARADGERGNDQLLRVRQSRGCTAKASPPVAR